MSMLHNLPGGRALIEWFGGAPRFHDAELLELTFSNKGSGLMRLHAWNMTDQVDDEGYFINDKHAIVTLLLEGVRSINCVDFDMKPGIIYDLKITAVDELYRVEWSASYGLEGSITAKGVQINLMPGKPAKQNMESSS